MAALPAPFGWIASRALPLIAFRGYVYAWWLIPQNMIGRAVWEELRRVLAGG
jgi:hypothetical protein